MGVKTSITRRRRRRREEEEGENTFNQQEVCGKSLYLSYVTALKSELFHSR